MLKILHQINNLISSKYANIEATRYNFIMLLFYKLAFPASKVLKYLSIKPNTITLIAFLFSITSFYFILQNNIFYFIIFWLLSMYFDFCDGTVARMTNRKTNFNFNIDHYVDIIKICLFFLVVGVKFNSLNIWIITGMMIFAFLFAEIVVQEVKLFRFSTNENSPQKQIDTNKNIEISFSIEKYNFIYVIYKNIYTILFGINAHTLLLFCFIPINIIYAKYILLYLLILSIKSIIRNLLFLV